MNPGKPRQIEFAVAAPLRKHERPNAPPTQGGLRPVFMHDRNGNLLLRKPKADSWMGPRKQYPIYSLAHEKPGELRKWRDRIAARAKVEWKGPPTDGPVALELTFVIVRPKSVPRKKRRWPCTGCDWDKLSRAVCDALTKIVYTNDARIVRATVAKIYGEVAGVRVVVGELQE